MAANNDGSTPAQPSAVLDPQTPEKNKSGYYLGIMDTPGSGKRPHSPIRFDLSPKRQLGIEQWANNQDFSDIIVRYGENGEEEFSGHRCILAGASIWFRDAFLGGFKESGASEITLKDDDPAAIIVMLNACYKNNCEYPLYSDGSSSKDQYSVQPVLWHLGIYKVADKYDIPKLVHVAILQAGHPLTRFLSVTEQGLFQAEVRNIARDMPQFAQDLFLFLSRPLTGTEPSRFLALVEEVKCPRPACNKMQWKPTVNPRTACQGCGAQIDWKERTVQPGPIQ